MAQRQAARGSRLSGALQRDPIAGGFAAPVAGRPVAGGRGGPIYAGGTPNFDERTGKYIVPPKSGPPVYLPENPPPRMGPGFQGPLERVSPGIYRNASGSLVNSSGGRLPSNVYRQPGYAQYDPRNPQVQPQDAIRGGMSGIASGVGGAFGGAGRPMPRPISGVMEGAVNGIGNAVGGFPMRFPQGPEAPAGTGFADGSGNALGNYAGAGLPMPRPVLNNMQNAYNQMGQYQTQFDDSMQAAGINQAQQQMFPFNRR